MTSPQGAEAVRKLARSFIDDQAIEGTPGDESPAPPDDFVDDAGEPPGVALNDSLQDTPEEATDRKKRGKSWTWQFMERTGVTKNHPAVCTVCLKEKGVRTEIKRYDGSTKLMIQHLREEHRITEKGKESASSAGRKNATPYPPRGETRKQLIWKLTRWLLISKRAFGVVDSDEFRTYCSALDPRFVVPTRSTIRNVGHRMFNSTMAAVKEALRSLWQHYPSYTCDLWSALDGSQYLGLQIHAIDYDWEYFKFSTGTVVLPPPHDQLRVADAIDTQLSQMGFDGTKYKITATTDAGSNMKAAVEGQLTHDWLPCFNHMVHLVLGDVLKMEEVQEVVSCVRKVCAMFRTSPAKWEQLRKLQEEIVKSNLGGASDVYEEQEDEVDDTGEEPTFEVHQLTKILRPKIDMVVRWNSVFSMLQRALQLKLAIELYYAKHGSELKDTDANRLTQDQWIKTMDIVDMLGPFKPMTTSMEVDGSSAIVHVLPQLLRLLARLTRVAEGAHKYSGRTVFALAEKYGVGVANVEGMKSPIQDNMYKTIMAGFFGEKGVHAKNAGRANSCAILYSWAICSGIYPSHLQKWSERISEPLQAITKQGYLKAAFVETLHLYKSDILGVQSDGMFEQQSEDDSVAAGSDDTDTGGDGTEGGVGGALGGQRDDQRARDGVFGGMGIDESMDGQPPAKRARKANRKYLTSPPKPLNKKSKVVGRGKRKGKSKLPREGVTDAACYRLGDMLYALVVDEIRAMTIEAHEKKKEGNSVPSGDGLVKALAARKSMGKVGGEAQNFEEYSDEDSEQGVAVVEGKDAIADEMHAFKVEKNKEGWPVLEWWKRHGGKYPNLSITARRILAVRATSSAAEREFSAAGQVSTKYRQNLTHESMNLCTFCSQNKMYVPESLPTE